MRTEMLSFLRSVLESVMGRAGSQNQGSPTLDKPPQFLTLSLGPLIPSAKLLIKTFSYGGLRSRGGGSLDEHCGPVAASDSALRMHPGK